MDLTLTSGEIPSEAMTISKDDKIIGQNKRRIKKERGYRFLILYVQVTERFRTYPCASDLSAVDRDVRAGRLNQI